MEGPKPTVAGALPTKIEDPCRWLALRDRDPELHRTIRHNLVNLRVAEAVQCLEWHVGRTAMVRSAVDGWDCDTWRTAVADLARNRTAAECRRMLRTLKAIHSTPKDAKDA